MKKKMLFTLCLMALTTFSSQAQSSPYPMRSKMEATRILAGSHRLDSIVRTAQESRRMEKSVMEYDGGGNLTVINSYTRANGHWEPTQRMEYSINERGLLERSTIYVWEDGEYCMAECEEVEQFTPTGQTKVVVISERLEAGASSVQPVLKQVVTGRHQEQLTDYDLYTWQMDNWIKIGHSHTEYSDGGRHVSEVLTISFSGMTMAQGVDIDYDDYGQPWRVNEYLLDRGERLLNVETCYDNEYGDDGLLMCRTITSSDGSEPVVDRYCWSRSTTTAMGSVTKGSKATPDSFYDLSGRCHHGQPTQSGVYIINGRKVVRK